MSKPPNCVIRAPSLRCRPKREVCLTGSIRISKFTRAQENQRTDFELHALPPSHSRTVCRPRAIISIWKPMPAIIMDGRKVSEHLKPELRRHARELADNHNLVPGLAAVLVGENPASMQYVRNKRRLSDELGFRNEMVTIAEQEATTERLVEIIKRLNGDPHINGILIQLPLPERVDTYRLFDVIAAHKDVDAVGVANVASFYRAQWGHFIPCTPRGVLTLRDHYMVPSPYPRPRRDLPRGRPARLMRGRGPRRTPVSRHGRHGEARRMCSRCRVQAHRSGTLRRRCGFRGGQGSRWMGHAEPGRNGSDDGRGADAKPGGRGTVFAGPRARALLHLIPISDRRRGIWPCRPPAPIPCTLPFAIKGIAEKHLWPPKAVVPRTVRVPRATVPMAKNVPLATS